MSCIHAAVISAADMDMWQDRIGTYHMKGDIRWDPNPE